MPTSESDNSHTTRYLQVSLVVSQPCWLALSWSDQLEETLVSSPKKQVYFGEEGEN